MAKFNNWSSHQKNGKKSTKSYALLSFEKAVKRFGIESSRLVAVKPKSITETINETIW